MRYINPYEKGEHHPGCPRHPDHLDHDDEQPGCECDELARYDWDAEMERRVDRERDEGGEG